MSLFKTALRSQPIHDGLLLTILLTLPATVVWGLLVGWGLAEFMLAWALIAVGALSGVVVLLKEEEEE